LKVKLFQILNVFNNYISNNSFWIFPSGRERRGGGRGLGELGVGRGEGGGKVSQTVNRQFILPSDMYSRVNTLVLQ